VLSGARWLRHILIIDKRAPSYITGNHDGIKGDVPWEMLELIASRDDFISILSHN
jgi:hypothetical protein